jgi:hypothetical protein
MIRTAKWLVRAVFAAGIVGALGFGAQQAVADRNAKDPCVCAHPTSTNECYECCGLPDGGVCNAGHYCVCL